MRIELTAKQTSTLLLCSSSFAVFPHSKILQAISGWLKRLVTIAELQNVLASVWSGTLLQLLILIGSLFNSECPNLGMSGCPSIYLYCEVLAQITQITQIIQSITQI